MDAQTPLATGPPAVESWYFANENSFASVSDRTFLQGAGVALTLTFTYCNENGLLVYSQGGSDEYFGVGIVDHKVVVQFRQDSKTSEVGGVM